MSALRAAWVTLSATLMLRRRLEACQRPVEDIGKLASPSSGESYEVFKARIQAKHVEERRERAALKERHDIRTAKDLERKLTSLRAAETQLWALCRPDLYPLGGGGQ